MSSDRAAALFEAANKHFAAGRRAEAEKALTEAVKIAPDHPYSLYLRGMAAGEAGRLDESLGLLDQAIALAPNLAEAHGNRAAALTFLGRLDEGAQAFRRALELNPGQVAAWFSLGNVEARRNQNYAAFEAFLQVLQIEPGNGAAWTNMAIALHKVGKLDDALAAYQKALSLEPEEALIHFNIAVTLLALGRTYDAFNASCRAVELDPSYVMAHSNVLLCMAYQGGGSGAEHLAAHKAWDELHAQPLKPASVSYNNSRDPERRLKIGYVSCDFQAHPVGWLLANVLPAHDKAKVEVFCYANDVVEDEVTTQLKACADHWRDITGMDDDEVAARVRWDHIDILVDLTGHTGKNRLLAFAREPAPVQASWIGYPGTTGMSAMDYLIMDAATAPTGAEDWCSEALVRLPHGRFCYAAPADAPAVAERPQGPVVFGSFNHLAKLSPDVVRLWARVLAAVPGSRLVLKWRSASEASVQVWLRAAFAAEGIGADRLELRGGSSHADMLGEYGDIDIALDPFPYTGGITSAEALWMGVPVVTLPGDTIPSRQTFAFLTELGLTDLAASSEDDYVRIAAELAGDPARRAELRRTLRPRMAASPLTDGAQFTPGLEDAYRQMWRRWCADETPAGFDVA
jgi:protein O-GlcNAc transferase